MSYDFDTRVDRSGLASIRELATPQAAAAEDLVSFWGAEFEFKMPDFMIQALKNWADKGLAAYNYMDQQLLEQVKFWMNYHRDWQIDTSWIVPVNGLMFSVGTVCRAFTRPGDGIIGFNPVYHSTWKPVERNGRVHVNCPLIFNGEEYLIDFELLENLMFDSSNKVLTICNPHNPIGKIWGREDLERLAELAIRYDVIIFSDEIFADCVYEDRRMLSFSQITDKPLKWIAATSIGKTFSFTGVSQAHMIISA